MILENQDNNKTTGLGEVGSRLVSLHPDFDVRSYGYNMLSKFLEEFEKIELVKKGNFVAVALREDRRQKADVDKYLLQIVKASGASGIEPVSYTHLYRGADRAGVQKSGSSSGSGRNFI